jgi:hypothetical protein
MKSLTALFSHGLVLSLSAIGLAADSVPGPNPASPLAPLAFFTTHEWTAKLPDGPDGRKVSIHARFAWAENHQSIRISNQFIMNGKAMPYIDGLYVWNPQKRAIVCWYADAEGNLSEGTVTVSEGKLVHEFQEIHGDGKVESFVARVTPLADETGWDNEILARKGDGLVPVVKVQYLADK